LGQALVKEINQESITEQERQVMQIILELCIEKYGINQLSEDDIQQFEYFSNNLDHHFDEVEELLLQFNFIPCPLVTPSASFRLLEIAKKELKVIDQIFKNGFCVKEINDSFMQMVLGNIPEHKHLVEKFLQIGILSITRVQTEQESDYTTIEK
jgi:hypothetical protein